MKNIIYSEEFLSATGQPILLPDPDVLKQKAARDEALKEGKTIYDSPQVSATFASLVIWFADNIPHERAEQGKPARKISISDAGNAYAVIKAFRDVQNGAVQLEDAVYKWLLETIDIDGPVALRGPNAAVLKERLQNLSESPK